MPRGPRIDAPGLLQHVIARGIERRQIFIDDDDYRFFIDKLGDVLIESGADCYAWVLMPNHFHLLIRTGNRPLGNIMKRQLGAYATRFNLKHRRAGHLFQNRYKSIVVDKDSYLSTLIAYIHLNPLRAKLVKTIDGLSAYRYSGHRALAGKAVWAFQDTEFVLDYLGGQKAYLKYIHFAAAQEESDLDGGGLYRSLGIKRGEEIPKDRSGSFDHRILGDAEFAVDILGLLEDRHESPTQELLDRSLEAVCARFDIGKEALKGESREHTLAAARSVFAVLAKSLGFTGAQIAREMAKTEAAVVKAVARGAGHPRIVSELRDQLVGKGG